MKKALVLGLILTFSLFAVACGNNEASSQNADKKKISIELDNTKLETHANMTAIISGTTEPNATVIIKYDELGMGHKDDLKTLKTKAASSGRFAQTVDWQTDYTVYAKKGNSKSEEKIVTVTHSEEAKKAIEEKNENEEKEKQNTAKENANSISFQMLNKNADKYVGEPYYIKGKVIQAIEDGGTTLLRVDMTQNEYGNWDNTVAIIYNGTTDAVEDNIIEVYGTIYGNYDYKSTIGADLTIPGIDADNINVVK
ncbi:hypothetical protein ACRW9N_02520 [Listeria aquatica]|uniref:hypothetical protein n=1 Tax=Listeria aquatica TaxID=1494960 RepID=UPI003EFAEB4B